MLLSSPLIMLLALGTLAPEAEGTAKATAAIAPLLGDEVAALAQVDLAKLNVPNFVRSVVGPLADEEDVSRLTKAAGGWIESLQKAGAKDLFVLIDPADMPGIPVLVVPLSDGTDGPAVAKLLTASLLSGGTQFKPASETIRGAVVAGSATSLARIREAKPKDRPEIAAALTANGSGAAVRVVLVPSTTQRRAIEESMPNLPPELGGVPITTVTRGFIWASLALAAEPKPTFHAVVQAQDAEAAKSLQALAQDAFKLLVRTAAADPGMAEVVQTLGKTSSQIQGDRIVLDADLEKTATLVAVPIQKAREAARRSQCVNNLKQIGLAMHNYHSTYNTFPPAYTTSKDGKPLLSWRVLILPYLEQEPLYKEFKLDQPWDSPHNQALISRMPPMLACPSGSRKLAGEGKTTYLTPRGASTIFPGSTPVKLQEITDGTSNTILVIDANDNTAVTWTKPDDWEITTPLSTKGLFGHHPNGTNYGFGDGSVRFLEETITPELLLKLLTRDGGEVISSDEL